MPDLYIDYTDYDTWPGENLNSSIVQALSPVETDINSLSLVLYRCSIDFNNFHLLEEGDTFTLLVYVQEDVEEVIQAVVVDKNEPGVGYPWITFKTA